MTVVALNQYIRWLRSELKWQRTGPVHKALVKHLAVAEKTREIRRGQEAARDV